MGSRSGKKKYDLTITSYVNRLSRKRVEEKVGDVTVLKTEYTQGEQVAKKKKRAVYRYKS